MQDTFVVYENPILHRENNGSEIILSTDNEVRNVIPVPINDWLCDLCGDDVPVQTDEGKPIAVFVYNNTKALCWNCTKEVTTYDTELLMRIGWCSCCTDKDANKWLYHEKDNMYYPIAKFNSDEQCDRFGGLFVEQTGQELVCITGELSEPLQKNKQER